MVAGLFDIAEGAAKRLSSMFDIPTVDRLSSRLGGGGPGQRFSSNIGNGGDVRYSSALGGGPGQRFSSYNDAGSTQRFDVVGRMDPARNAYAAGQEAGQRAAATLGGKTPTLPNTGGGGGAAGIAGDETWNRIDQYAGLIDEAAAAAGIDGDVFRAIMYNESHGDPNARHAGSGASGLLQLMPGNWGEGEDPFNPADNLRAGARLMQQKVKAVRDAYAANGIQADERTFARDLALAWAGHFDYDTGRPNPTSRDNYVGGQTAEQLANVFLGHYDQLKAARSQRGQQPGIGGTGGLNSLFGGAAFPTTQEFGHTDFSGGEGASIYDFGAQFGLDGDEHSGLDIGAPDGTKTYSPVGGTVIIAGGSGYYKDETGRDPATSGEVRIRLDNGHELILGHMGNISLQQGQRINAGDFVGLTGTANGPHLHVEYRIPDPSTKSGWRIVNPRDYL